MIKAVFTTLSYYRVRYMANEAKNLKDFSYQGLTIVASPFSRMGIEHLRH